MTFQDFEVFPKNPKSQGVEGNLSSCCFKAHWEMPSSVNAQLSRDAAGLEPSLQHSGASPSPGGQGTPRAVAFLPSAAPNSELWLAYGNWSCPFRLDPGALALPAPCPAPAPSPSLSSRSGGSRAACCAAFPPPVCVCNILKVR